MEKRKLPDHYVSDLRRLGGNGAGALEDYTALRVVQPRNPQARPNYRVMLGRLEFRMLESLRAEDENGELETVYMPWEDLVYTGDLLVDAVSVEHIDIDHLCKELRELQARQHSEMAEYIERKRARKREHRRRYNARKKEKEKKKRGPKTETASQRPRPSARYQPTAG